ncbi:Riboflavin biosynthesis protein RibD [Campylobacter majalis]|uniref:Riboflavin biosynthesis protein RibD n=1 Tax=Campylobacter majalis TaxID=2790656 RepID=A0ABN7K3L5_9BACT|nr:bifunctional diaminohydroxyphosphoribosylaminopyrimidine deaminase/5-amino-6-(5-phosphoribosylamino)uracil reductase RibD [Campylobacter majalis]CAD7286680.1 Riboflavin biosynthesis protein RibD [Campylobacter majalis]
MSDEFYMDLALNEAWKYQILTYPNPAVGCVICDKFGKILSIKAHKKAGYLHAEPMAILFALFNLNDEILNKFLNEYNVCFTQSFKTLTELNEADLDAKFCYEFILSNHGNLLNDASAYVTLEPCSHHGKTPACAILIKQLGFKRVIISVCDENKIASGGAKILKEAGIDVKIGVLKEHTKKLMLPFKTWLNGNFIFYKLAMSANGVITGGIISNELSRTHMHKLRGVIDLLVIGGNTVRVDRPVLDARLANAKAPDVAIYSTKRDFDTDIALFSVKNRNVEILDNLEVINKPLVMIEGGEQMLKKIALGEILNVKWVLIYQSSEFKNADNIKLDVRLKPLYEGRLGDDRYGWYEVC